MVGACLLTGGPGSVPRRPARRPLVCTFEFADAPDAIVLKSIHIDQVRERVRLTDRSVFLTAGDRDNALRAGMRAGSIDAMQRLATRLSANGRST